jgi:hypothetical protein
MICGSDLFILLCCHIHLKLRAKCGLGSLGGQAPLAIEAVGFLLLIRNIIQAGEYLQGSGGYVVSHEFFI